MVSVTPNIREVNHFTIHKHEEGASMVHSGGLLVLLVGHEIFLGFRADTTCRVEVTTDNSGMISLGPVMGRTLMVKVAIPGVKVGELPTLVAFFAFLSAFFNIGLLTQTVREIRAVVSADVTS